MRWATCFLPSCSTLETSWVTSCDPNTGSTSSGRFGAGPLRGISALLLLRAVAAASLLAVLHALGVERAADDLVADTGEVLHPAAAHEHDRVLLQVVADAGDVGGDLDAGRQPHAGDLAQRGVRLLGGGRVDTRAHAAPLGRPLQSGRLVLRHLVLAALADQLVDGGHRVVPLLPESLSSAGDAGLTLSGAGECCLRVPPCTSPAKRLPRGRACRRPQVTARPQRDPSVQRWGAVAHSRARRAWASQTRRARLPARPNAVKTSSAVSHEAAQP